jgi:bifunctional non-homologous end joining protein LigD
MTVWDTGTYDIEEWEDRKLVVVLHGDRARGKYAIFGTRGRDWIIHRMDPPEDPTRQAPPHDLLPMRATSGALPKTKGWAFELAWSGVRVLLANEPGLVTITDAEGADVASAFPEVRRIGRALGAEDVILDGVITAAAGPDALAKRLAAKSDSTVRRLSRDQPAVFVAFDLIWNDGHQCWDDAWSARRDRLEALALAGDHWQVPTAHVGDGAALADAARGSGVHALVAKKVGSTYRPGGESDDWVEVGL